ncbi:hypothetical protein LTR37_005536 [Vermiconidia calcicola]|uniref:Uncharacterized protein n=1 Tax=Vermiconidia calcicola TaxID=1690605 RepID=A0ACC3NKG9_9PEZI|nr:hypothetical protein LTR37_005536 [Vermiconidia calcicola]
MAALIDRDTNAQPTSNPTKDPEKPAIGEENKPQDGRQQYNYQVLEKAVAESNGKSNHYISPSDAIMSPASQKLSGFKQRQIDKQGAKAPAARTLFARNVSGSASGFEDVDAGGEKQ